LAADREALAGVARASDPSPLLLLFCEVFFVMFISVLDGWHFFSADFRPPGGIPSGFAQEGCLMRVSMLLMTVAAAALTGSAAKATSVTVNFPAAGDSWCGTFGGVGTCGTLSGYSGKMRAENDFVTSASGDTYPIPAHFVATGVSGTLNISSTSAYTVIDFFYPGSPYQLTLNDYVGAGPVPFSFTFSTPTPLYPDSPFTVLLGNNIPQTNPISGNWIPRLSG